VPFLCKQLFFKLVEAGGARYMPRHRADGMKAQANGGLHHAGMLEIRVVRPSSPARIKAARRPRRDDRINSSQKSLRNRHSVFMYLRERRSQLNFGVLFSGFERAARGSYGLACLS
jgi:hypothetical protein